MENALPASAQRVQAALQAAGKEITVLDLPASTRSASEAAAAIGCNMRKFVRLPARRIRFFA